MGFKLRRVAVICSQSCQRLGKLTYDCNQKAQGLAPLVTIGLGGSGVSSRVCRQAGR
jgi:hypothetical protein